jgi:hypothetical protein
MQLLVYQEATRWRRGCFCLFSWRERIRCLLIRHNTLIRIREIQSQTNFRITAPDTLEKVWKDRAAQDKDDRKNVPRMEYVSTDMQVYHYYPFGLTFLRLVARISSGRWVLHSTRTLQY